eukprot:501618-Hanusia_phi.AAC.1
MPTNEEGRGIRDLFRLPKDFFKLPSNFKNYQKFISYGWGGFAVVAVAAYGSSWVWQHAVKYFSPTEHEGKDD